MEAASTIFGLVVGTLPGHLWSFAEDATPMTSFESIFNIPLEHRLVLVRSRSLGGETPSEQWDHESGITVGGSSRVTRASSNGIQSWDAHAQTPEGMNEPAVQAATS